ncbi:MAG: 30S ribosomal protein S28e [Euryarchaeota archaeon HGW-Euryarchaeota-1]|nr:MAG: 30S ribosomal protein S28e [Euryarchaeota archaeon HGW-Euryarchaeota-1]
MSVANPQQQEFPALGEIVEIGDKGGSSGKNITFVKVKILSGRDEGKTINRNVSGPVEIGMLVRLVETRTEA